MQFQDFTKTCILHACIFSVMREKCMHFFTFWPKQCIFRQIFLNFQKFSIETMHIFKKPKQCMQIACLKSETMHFAFLKQCIAYMQCILCNNHALQRLFYLPRGEFKDFFFCGSVWAVPLSPLLSSSWCVSTSRTFLRARAVCSKWS